MAGVLTKLLSYAADEAAAEAPPRFLPYGHPIYGDQMRALADRVAYNRVVAGVHFPVDSAAGCALGDVLAKFFVGLCDGKKVEAITFNGGAFCVDSTTGDFDVSLPQKDQPGLTLHTKISVSPTPALNWLWKRALAEWK